MICPACPTSETGQTFHVSFNENFEFHKFTVLSWFCYHHKLLTMSICSIQTGIFFLRNEQNKSSQKLKSFFCSEKLPTKALKVTGPFGQQSALVDTPYAMLGEYILLPAHPAREFTFSLMSNTVHTCCIFCLHSDKVKKTSLSTVSRRRQHLHSSSRYEMCA